MLCMSPMSIKNPSKTATTARITVPCGKCVSCLSRKRNAWSLRLQNEARSSKSAVFITLTYDNDKLKYSPEGFPEVRKEDIQKFLKRLRKLINKESYREIRYFITSEYGPKTQRPHYHGLIFNLPYTRIEDQVKLTNILRTCWQNGFVTVGTVTEASIAYVTKYVLTKSQNLGDRQKEFALMSRNPGIGISYLTNEIINYHKNGQIKRFYGVLKGGNKVALPRYYSDKIFNQIDRKEHLKEIQKLMDDKYNEFLENTPDAFNNELQSKIQITETKSKRLTKNSKL